MSHQNPQTESQTMSNRLPYITDPKPAKPACLTCGKPLTDDDPVVTTLGPRCAKHF
jgi:hypothetical protein